MAFQIGGSGPTYYKGNMLAGQSNPVATDASLKDNFYTTGAGAKNMVWDDHEDKNLESKDGKDLNKNGYQSILDNFDGIAKVSQSDGSGGDGHSITAQGLYDYAATCTDPKAQRAMILMCTNPDLLNKLDGSDHNGRIAKDAVQSSHDGADDDSANTNTDKDTFKTQMHLVGNDAAGSFMDRLEGLSGGSGGNGLFGAKGMAALATLNDGNHDYDPIFNAPKGSQTQLDAITKWENDRKADGSLPQNVNDQEVANLFNGGGFKNGGNYAGLLNDGGGRSYSNAANWIVNGNGDSETQGTGNGSFNKMWTDFLGNHNGAPSYKDLAGY